MMIAIIAIISGWAVLSVIGGEAQRVKNQQELNRRASAEAAPAEKH